MSERLSSLRTSFTGYLNYRGREGQFTFLLHRITGLGTLLFLIIHILDTATVYYFPELYDHAIALYRSPLFMVGEIALFYSVIFHGVNGLRVAYVDLFKPQNWTIEKQRRAARITFALSIVLWLPAAFIMGRNLIASL
jgi:succinate dehydrogenase / fumarate reductase cytochrome b subunit